MGLKTQQRCIYIPLYCWQPIFGIPGRDLR